MTPTLNRRLPILQLALWPSRLIASLAQVSATSSPRCRMPIAGQRGLWAGARPVMALRLRPVRSTRAAVHPEVRRALEEVRALRDALAQERATAVAKRYEGVCDEPDALAGRLAPAARAGRRAYGAYVALLDELAEATSDRAVHEGIRLLAQRRRGAGCARGRDNARRSQAHARAGGRARLSERSGHT